MKIRTKHSPLLFLLLPSIAYALSAHDIADLPAPAAVPEATNEIPQAGLNRHDVPTKDAPVDGKDGKPHHGPFIETTDDHKRTNAPAPGSVEGDPDTLPQLKGRPVDPTIVDGKKIPETNDGVMFDTNRVHAQEGTTGTEGGVTEKYKAKKLEEDLNGASFKKPEAPKEAPPLPHSEEEKIRASGGVVNEPGKDTEKEVGSQYEKEKEGEAVKPLVKGTKGNEDMDYTGLDVSIDSPAKNLRPGLLTLF